MFRSPVCYSKDGLVLKLLSDGLLQQFVGLLIHAGRGFIDTQELQGRKAEPHVPLLTL